MILHLEMDDRGFPEDPELDKESSQLVRFKSSDDFRKVMEDMFPHPTPQTRIRAVQKWSRLRRQHTTNTDVTDAGDSVFLPSEYDVTFTSRASMELRRSKSSSRLIKRSSTRSLLSDAGSSTPTLPPSVSWAEAEETRQKLEEASDQGWRKIRRYVEDKKFERQTNNVTTTWAMLRQHLFNMSDLERTRKDLYERYGVLPRLNNDGTYTISNVMMSPRSRTTVTKSKATSHVGFTHNS